MNSSFLYHAWDLYNHKCTREEYKGNSIILHVEAKEREKVCSRCGHGQLAKNGFRVRDFIGLPIGGKEVIIRMKDTAALLGVSWDTVKDIHTRHLEYRYAHPSLEGVDCIGIDEFALKKGHSMWSGS